MKRKNGKKKRKKNEKAMEKNKKKRRAQIQTGGKNKTEQRVKEKK